MTTIWLANTASLLLPVSNLTNLLGSNRIALDTQQFAGRMWVPQIVSIAVTMAFLWVFYWRRGQRRDLRYTPPLPEPVADRVLFAAAAAACLLFIGALLLKVQVGVAASGAALVVVVAFLVRAPRPADVEPGPLAAADLRDGPVPGGAHPQPVRPGRPDALDDRRRGRRPTGRRRWVPGCPT